MADNERRKVFERRDKGSERRVRVFPRRISSRSPEEVGVPDRRQESRRKRERRIRREGDSESESRIICGMSCLVADLEKDCPCVVAECPRFGNCVACYDYHKNLDRPSACRVAGATVSAEHTARVNARLRLAGRIA